MEDSLKSLAGIEILSELGELDRSMAEQSCSWRWYDAGEQIISDQDESTDVFFVISGKVRVVSYSMSGREVSFEDIPAGSFFGELAAIDNQPRSAGIEALEQSFLASMPPTLFLQLVTRNPGPAGAMLQRLAHVVRTSTGRIMDLSTLGAKNRVYGELLRLASQDRRDDNTAVIHPIPIHADIASRVSTTRETVARTLTELSKKEIVKREKDSLLLLDFDRLDEMVREFAD